MPEIAGMWAWTGTSTFDRVERFMATGPVFALPPSDALDAPVIGSVATAFQGSDGYHWWTTYGKGRGCGSMREAMAMADQSLVEHGIQVHGPVELSELVGTYQPTPMLDTQNREANE